MKTNKQINELILKNAYKNRIFYYCEKDDYLYFSDSFAVVKIDKKQCFVNLEKIENFKNIDKRFEGVLSSVGSEKIEYRLEGIQFKKDVEVGVFKNGDKKAYVNKDLVKTFFGDIYKIILKSLNSTLFSVYDLETQQLLGFICPVVFKGE